MLKLLLYTTVTNTSKIWAWFSSLYWEFILGIFLSPKYIFVSENIFYFRGPLYAKFWGIINYNQLHFPVTLFRI